MFIPLIIVGLALIAYGVLVIRGSLRRYLPAKYLLLGGLVALLAGGGPSVFISDNKAITVETATYQSLNKALREEERHYIKTGHYLSQIAEPEDQNIHIFLLPLPNDSLAISARSQKPLISFSARLTKGRRSATSCQSVTRLFHHSLCQNGHFQ